MGQTTYPERLASYHLEEIEYEKELAEVKHYNEHERPIGGRNKRLPLMPTPPLMCPEDLR